MIVNFANRAHNHNFESDWAVRSLLDTDYYKLAMLQFIWLHFPKTQVSFSLINRKKTVRLGDDINEPELRRQLDHVRDLMFTKSELIWLAGNTFYGQVGIFRPQFIAFLKDFALPDYDLRREDGQWILTFDGTWLETTMWEIYALSTINELRTRAGLAKLSEFELDMLYAAMKTKAWAKISKLRGVPGLKIADFGTRRRHSFLWQEYMVTAFKAELPDIFTGTSNAYLAFKHDLEAIGTNAHELPMVLAALANSDEELKMSQYEVLKLWHQTYGDAMAIFLPDTFGTTQFLKDAPDFVADFKGARLDSKSPFVGGDEIIDFFKGRGRNPLDKLIIPSDGLDVDIILSLHAYFGGRIMDGYKPEDFQSAADFLDPAKWTHEPRIRDSYGWGTLLTNDSRGCHPRGLTDFDPLSLVCKVKSVNGRGAVKLSDNFTKQTGPEGEIERYRRKFGFEGVENAPVIV